jgi:adenosylcobinamide kinase/adenosylcobinamide-phosphate guanylyltransferase
MNGITFVTGGARSGKSRYAIETAERRSRKAFIATAESTDDEMRRRIERHQVERGEGFITIEEPIDLAGALLKLPKETEIAVVDCLTVWLGNLMHYRKNPSDEYAEVHDFLNALQKPPCPLVIVSNETGMGLVPDTPLGRRFRDLAGTVNQAAARMADRVVFMVSGIPLFIKGSDK